MRDEGEAARPPGGPVRHGWFAGILEGRRGDVETLRNAVRRLNALGLAHADLQLEGGRFNLLLDERIVPGSRFGPEVSTAFVERLQEIVDASLYRAVEAGAYASFEATEGNVEAFEAAILREHDHMECWRKEDIPARFQYGTHRRIPPYFCLPDTGWTITNRASDSEWSGGNHGYDPYAPEMASLFIAHGAAFRSGTVIDSFQNTAITPLLRHLIGLPQAQRADGSLAEVAGALAPQK